MSNPIKTLFGLMFLIAAAMVLAYVFYPRSDNPIATSSSSDDMRALIEKDLAEEKANLQKQFSELRQNLQEDQKVLLDKIAVELDQLTRRIGVAERDLAARPVPSAIALARDVDVLAVELRQEIVRLAQQVQQPKGSASSLLGLSLMVLQDAASSGGDFSRELEVIQTLLPSSPSVKALLAYRMGVASRQQLTRRFDRLADEARLEAVPMPSPLMRSLLRIVRVRPLGELEGKDAYALLAQLTQKVKLGDFAEAVELEMLLAQTPKVHAILASWFEEAKQRVALERALGQLDLEIYELLAANEKRFAR